MKRDLDDIAVFVQVVTNGGFTAAARTAGCTPSSVSKRVARLEDRLGIALLNQTTRKLALSAAGRAFYESCSTAMTEIDRALDTTKSLRKVRQGLLRVKVPQAYGKMHIAPLIPDFLSRYPHVGLEMVFVNFNQDVIENGIDVIISPADPANSNLTSRVLVPIERVTCAAPKCIERYGMPKSFEDLAAHNCLMFSDSTFPANEWVYHLRDGIERVKVTGNLVTNNGDAIVRAVLASIGIAHIPRFVVEGALTAGHLKIIFQDHVSNSRTRPMMKAYYAPAKHPPAQGSGVRQLSDRRTQK